MAIEEHRRIALHRAAAASWGEENADTLVNLVTPAGHEMATKADIKTVLSAIDAMDDRWEERLSVMNDRWASQLETTEHRLTATFERGIRDAVITQTRVLVISVLVAVVTMGGLTLSVAS
jgi:hypothetical protein